MICCLLMTINGISMINNETTSFIVYYGDTIDGHQQTTSFIVYHVDTIDGHQQTTNH